MHLFSVHPNRSEIPKLRLSGLFNPGVIFDLLCDPIVFLPGQVFKSDAFESLKGGTGFISCLLRELAF